MRPEQPKCALAAVRQKAEQMGDKKKKTKWVITVCRESKCKDKGAKKVAERLKELVEEQGIEATVKIKKADCFGKCKEGPIVECAAIPLRFTNVSPEDAEVIIARCLAGNAEKKSRGPSKRD
ncbi:MAG TPA: (2Fe-2S) ferredoxin domain-containing protein [Candidatus Hydrogenedentes bacterium]|nr:(2Fe-2S) ferredoxin domain-containing protein [Candidatus Hydrogenedentota bacterium]HOV74292.1 (2Fe-2S) ferredoxin domain-containing protein [Candidatus Hydrogenedentota bacterium]HPC15015.1 (2Fe-2S) ferredoxin domain-containing protein [Candidatus Hydrogenedentota bacterium]HRT19124.1 (2Fe-2S) ferredoxin domain-containing protein [Candidatus Hydrogenedentota bacterium]HRT64053.1 (2Fe-2S) ferredoxin domain-containing protein [Candidatus Hydrogenedentota bacterium]